MEHIGRVMTAMERHCPVCHALPFQQCRSLIEPTKTIRYMHTERNR